MGNSAGMSAHVFEISLKEIRMDEKPFDHGGFGDVYKAKWRKNDVVVKVVRTYNEEQKQNVIHEANLTFSFRHPNVIDLFGIVQVNSWQVGIVMEKAKLGSLDLWIGKMDHGQLRKTALGIVHGLKYVHSQNVIHRDIKPRNILMFGPADNMIPKIADFGAAKIIERTTENTNIGEYTYIAPEVAQHCQYGFAADIFSLAVTMFEMFNEQLISRAPTEVKRFMLDVHAGKVAKIPRSKCVVPVYLINVVERGLSSNPAERPTLPEYQATLMNSAYGYFFKFN